MIRIPAGLSAMGARASGVAVPVIGVVLIALLFLVVPFALAAVLTVPIGLASRAHYRNSQIEAEQSDDQARGGSGSIGEPCEGCARWCLASTELDEPCVCKCRNHPEKRFNS